MSSVVRLALALAVSVLASCSAFKAPVARPSSFLTHASAMQEDAKAPFLRTWRNDSKNAKLALQKRTSIYVAPVTLKYLRPMSRTLAATSCSEEARQTAAAELATRFSSRVSDALSQAPNSQFKLSPRPSSNTLRLEIAIVEFNPNPLVGGVLRTAINTASIPGVDSVLAKRLKGNIAIEGRLSDPSTRTVLYEFADNEENKSPLIISVNDFRKFGQANQAIDEWAAQIAAVINARPGEQVKDASSFVILPWH